MLSLMIYFYKPAAKIPRPESGSGPKCSGSNGDGSPSANFGSDADGKVARDESEVS